MSGTYEEYARKVINGNGGNGNNAIENNNPSSRQSSRPNIRICYICGQGFGSKSLAIHQKTCLLKFEVEQSKLPPNMRRKLVIPSSFNTSGESGSNSKNSNSVDAYNDAAFNAYQQGLVPCENCGRTFLPDRLQVHLKSCKNIGPTARLIGRSGNAGGATMTIGRPTSSSSSSGGFSNEYNNNNNTRPQPMTLEKIKRSPSSSSSNTYNNNNNNNNNTYSGEENQFEMTSRSAISNISSIPNSPAMIKKNLPVNLKQIQTPATTKFAATPSSSSSSSSSSSFSSSSSSPFEQANQQQSRQMSRSNSNATSSNNNGTSGSFLIPCHICGRNFAADRIEKHQNVCATSSSRERKVFNSTKMRSEGTDISYNPKLAKEIQQIYASDTTTSSTKYNNNQNSNSNSQNSNKSVTLKKPPKWKVQHEEFMNAMKMVKQVTEYQNSGKNLADLPPPPPSSNPDYIQCPHCMRRFNPATAERHIPACANTRYKAKPPPSILMKQQQQQQQQQKSHQTTMSSKSNLSNSNNNSNNNNRSNQNMNSNTPLNTKAKAPTTQNIKFCFECGTKIESSNWKYCVDCGVTLQ